MRIEASYKTTERFLLRVCDWDRKFMIQNFMALKSPCSHCSNQTRGASGLGSVYGGCMALLCTFVGHRGAARKSDFPQNSAARQYKCILQLQYMSCFACSLPLTPILALSATCSKASLRVQTIFWVLFCFSTQCSKWDKTEQLLLTSPRLLDCTELVGKHRKVWTHTQYQVYSV